MCSALILASLSFKKGGDILCNPAALKEKASKSLEPYKYDSSELTRILYKKKESVKEVEVPLFIGEKYMFVFEMEALPKRVEVEIYNRDKDSKKRKLLFSSKGKTDLTEFQCEISKMRTVYVDYIVPASDESAQTGCALFVLGYKLK